MEQLCFINGGVEAWRRAQGHRASKRRRQAEVGALDHPPCFLCHVPVLSPVGCVTAHAAEPLWVSISLFFRAWVRSSAPPKSRPSAPTALSHQGALRDAPHSWSPWGSVGTMVSDSAESLRTSWDHMIGGMGK